MNCRIVIIALASTLLIGGGAFAQDGAAEENSTRENRRARLLDRFDTDGSGVIDEAEREAARQAVRERRGEFDADGDGTLSRRERRFAARSPQLKASCPGPGPDRHGWRRNDQCG